jgi:hypothetical protein
MALQDKYKELLDAASAPGISNLLFSEQDNILYIDGEAPTAGIKDRLWDIFGKIDPDFKAGDVMMDINIAAAALGTKATVTADSTALGTKATVTADSTALNIRKGPVPISRLLEKLHVVPMFTLISKTNEQWYLVKTAKDEEGYAYAQYLIRQ